MEMSIQRQRKALKHSIQHYVAAEERDNVLRSAAARISLTRNLTERKIRNRKINKKAQATANEAFPKGEMIANVHQMAGHLTED